MFRRSCTCRPATWPIVERESPRDREIMIVAPSVGCKFGMIAWQLRLKESVYELKWILPFYLPRRLCGPWIPSFQAINPRLTLNYLMCGV